MNLVSIEEFEKLKSRVEALEALLLQQDIQKTNLNVKQPTNRRGVGQNNLKMVYGEIFDRLDSLSAGFPRNKRPMAEGMKPGQKVFIYVTSPYKKIIGLAEPTSGMRDTGHPRWPYDVPLKWIIGPCTPGVSLKDAGIDTDEVRPRPGDTNFILTDEEATRIIELLEDQSPLTKSNVHNLI